MEKIIQRIFKDFMNIGLILKIAVSVVFTILAISIDILFLYIIWTI